MTPNHGTQANCIAPAHGAGKFGWATAGRYDWATFLILGHHEWLHERKATLSKAHRNINGDPPLDGNIEDRHRGFHASQSRIARGTLGQMKHGG